MDRDETFSALEWSLFDVLSKCSFHVRFRRNRHIMRRVAFESALLLSVVSFLHFMQFIVFMNVYTPFTVALRSTSRNVTHDGAVFGVNFKATLVVIIIIVAVVTIVCIMVIFKLHLDDAFEPQDHWAKHMSNSRWASSITPYTTCHVSRLFEVIWGHWPRVTFLLMAKFLIPYVLAHCYPYLVIWLTWWHPKICLQYRFWGLIFEVINWSRTLKLGIIGFFSSRVQNTTFPQTSNSISSRLSGGSNKPQP